MTCEIGETTRGEAKAYAGLNLKNAKSCFPRSVTEKPLERIDMLGRRESINQSSMAGTSSRGQSTRLCQHPVACSRVEAKIKNRLVHSGFGSCVADELEVVLVGA